MAVTPDVRTGSSGSKQVDALRRELAIAAARWDLALVEPLQPDTGRERAAGLLPAYGC